MNLVGSHFAPDINLSELQKTLDAQGIEVVENQKESVVGRKALADKTKGKGYLHPLHECVFLVWVRFQKDTRRREGQCLQGLVKVCVSAASIFMFHLSSILGIQRIKLRLITLPNALNPQRARFSTCTRSWQMRQIPTRCSRPPSFVFYSTSGLFQL